MSDEQVVSRERCPRCDERGADRSGDNLAVYSDGHKHCYACGHHVNAEGDRRVVEQSDKGTDFVPLDYECKRLDARRISSETCTRFGYGVGRDFNGKAVHICDVRGPKGDLRAQKVRTADKDFWTNGSLKSKPLIGMHLWGGGRMLVITEGELDMLSYAEVVKCKWPVVSLPNGAQNAKQVLAENLEYLSSFEKVVLMFDMDEPGQTAAKEAAQLLLGTTNVCLATLPLKDASECLQAGMSEEINRAAWNAQPYKPDDLVDVSDLIERMKKPKEKGLPWFMKGLNESSNGRNWGQVIMIGGGTGTGKTDLVLQQMDYDIRELGHKVAGFYLENDPEEVLEILCGKADGKLYYEENHPHAELVADKIKAAERYEDKLYLYDNAGICEWDSIKAKVLYLVNAGFRIFYIDNLTCLATGGKKDEKEELERIMAQAAEIVKRHNIIIHFVSHLATPEGKSHEEGGRVTIRHFKGSRAIGFWSHQLIGLERNQQAEGDEKYHTYARQLKRRGFGKGVGKTTCYVYDFDTGRQREITPEERDSPFEEERF